MNIGGFDLTQKVLIVAEIGNNHEGDFATAARETRARMRAALRLGG